MTPEQAKRERLITAALVGLIAADEAVTPEKRAVLLGQVTVWALTGIVVTMGADQARAVAETALRLAIESADMLHRGTLQ